MHDIIFHIGLHKTGTTTLQRQFFPMCEELNYISSPGDFITASTTKDPIYFDVAEYRNHVLEHLDPARPNLISSEALSGAITSGIIKRELDHRSSILENLKSAFPESRIVIVIRRQDRLALSLYRQYLLKGGTETIRRFYGLDGKKRPAISIDRFKFNKYIYAIKEAFPNGLLILTFEEFIKQRPRFLKKLTQFLGVTEPNIALQATNRTSLGPFGLEVSRLLNHVFHSSLNPGGPIPGVPILRNGRFKLVSPMRFIHNHWPWKGEVGPTSTLFQVGENILNQAKDDNRALDESYELGLDEYGYYD